MNYSTSSPKLSNAQKKYLRTIGHGLKPIVTVADKGLSEAVLTEIERAIGDHELIKIKLVVADRALRSEIIDQICQQCDAVQVQAIGKIVLIYRKNNKPNPRLSNILRH